MPPGPDTCDLILVKLALVVTKILHLSGFFWGGGGRRLQWPWPFELLTQNVISMNQITSATKIGCKFLHLFLRYGVYNLFGTHRLTQELIHGWTDPNTACLRRRSSGGGGELMRASWVCNDERHLQYITHLCHRHCRNAALWSIDASRRWRRTEASLILKD